MPVSRRFPQAGVSVRIQGPVLYAASYCSHYGRNLLQWVQRAFHACNLIVPDPLQFWEYRYPAALRYFLIIYILFSLSVNEFIFNLFGITAVVFSLVFSVEYLLDENPFSSHGGKYRAREEAANGPLPTENAGTRLHYLFNRIEKTLKRDNLFTDKDYSLKDLARDMDEREAILSETIKVAGFTNLCDLRLEYFKRQAENRPGKYVKELIFECGFTSRSTFYRNFTKRFGESPSRYMEK